MTTAQLKMLDEHANWLKDHNTGKRINIANRTIKKSTLQLINLSSAEMHNCRFENVDFNDVNFSSAKLTYCTLKHLDI